MDPQAEMCRSPTVFSLACSLLLKWPTQMLPIHHVPVCPSAPAVAVFLFLYLAPALLFLSLELDLTSKLCPQTGNPQRLDSDRRTCLGLLSDQYRLLHRVWFPALLLRPWGKIHSFPYTAILSPRYKHIHIQIDIYCVMNNIWTES